MNRVLNLLFILLFNMPFFIFASGSDFFSKGEYKQAAESFYKESLDKRGKSRVRALYNSALSYEKTFDKDKQAENILKAIDLYRLSLYLDPQLKEAAHNLELCLLKAYSSQNSESSKSESSKQEKQQKDKKLSQKQNDLAKDQNKEASNHQKAQEDLKKQSEEKAKNSQNKQEKEQYEKAAQEQQKALDALKKGDNEEAQKAQERASEILKEAEGDSKKNPPQTAEDKQINSLLNQENQREKNNNDKDFYKVEKNW